ncbi:PrsW family glutamic-type intramembrane protease [Paenibacillus sp. 1P07SE]|uniref:PrsW family glutamic-type intramembrane protease n=1 Tax=Paenibacillus sp. 1P07SE TaxID=3132209 RepID=UPI0039A60C36
MPESLLRLRNGIREHTEALHRGCKRLLARYPLLISLYGVMAWAAIIAFAVSLFFMEESRTLLLQFAWSFYVLLQFWFICRSKTITWKQYSLFFAIGAYGVIPLTNGFVSLVHAVFGGQTSDTWSVAVLTPVAEEVFKLLPLLLFLLFSRRATSLGLSDYALIGAATGAGFQFMEEITRRWITGFMPYGLTLFDGQVIHWEWNSLFPGYFELRIFSQLTSASHVVLTALAALGIGIGIRISRKLGRWAYSVPALLLALGIWDHALWNGQRDFPGWMQSIHETIGNGYLSKPLFVTLLLGAIVFDYWHLNTVGDKLHRLRGEPVLNPFTEAYGLLRALFRERYNFGTLLAFYRERRELGFTLLYGNAEARERTETLRASLARHYIPLTAVIGALLLMIVSLGWGSAFAMPDACFACLFDRLESWWERRSLVEQAALIAGFFVLSVPFMSVWAAVGVATTGAAVAASGSQIGDILRDPRKLLSPEYAAAAVIGLGLSRLPGGGTIARRVLPSAGGLKRYELTTAAGLKYRISLGAQGELRSVFAKIEPHHIGTGTATNRSSRAFVRRLGRQTDDAGHGIGNNLGGPGGARSGNLFPQTPSVNRGAFQQFEQQIVRAVNSGKEVYVRVVPNYPAGATRPDSIRYIVRIDGQTITRVFPNP